MSGLSALTARQRGILSLLAVIVVLVIGGGLWIIRTQMSSLVAISPLPTLTMPAPLPTSTPAPTLTPTITPTPAFELAEAGRIARDVAAARGVVPRWETPLTLVNQYELSTILYQRYQTWMPFPLSAQPTFAALGLWPEGGVRVDPVAQAVSAALYFPEESQMYLRRDWRGAPETIRRHVAYGYAQSLPEQYGDLPRLRSGSVSLDYRLALDALAAGDALLAIWLYHGVAPGSPEAQALTEDFAATVLPSWRLDEENALFDRLARVSLDLGAHFAETLYRQKGLAAMDAAVRRPPVTTAQLLHPDVDPVGGAPFTVFEPLQVNYLRAGWVVTHTAMLGEALMDFTLDTWSGEALTVTVAGWHGDMLQVWAGPDGAQLVLWQTAWTSRERAADFAWQMRGVMPGRIQPPILDTARPAGLPWGYWWAGAQDAAFLRRYADRVWLVWGNDAAAVTAVAAVLPRELDETTP